jgi:hypothetical protein
MSGDSGVLVVTRVRSTTIRECVFAVIARSEATKQSILSLRGTMDCFASLAMTLALSGLQPLDLPVVESYF